jgi:hypothetical protein
MHTPSPKIEEYIEFSKELNNNQFLEKPWELIIGTLSSLI